MIEDSKSKAMFDWVARENVQCPYRLADFASTGRGVVTIRGTAHIYLRFSTECSFVPTDLAEGEVISLPRKMIFNVEAAKASPIAKVPHGATVVSLNFFFFFL